MKDLSTYTLPNDQPVVVLECSKAFDALSNKEKLYAHYLSQACWHGGLVTVVQVSPESPAIFALLHKIYLGESISDLKKKALDSGVTEDEFTAFLVYSCGIFSFAGNYKDFGDTKIIPNMPKEKFSMIVKKSTAYQTDSAVVEKLLNQVIDIAYNLDEHLTSLGFANEGVTTYFSSNCTEADAQLVTEFMQHRNMELWNTRCCKTVDGSNCIYEIRIASIETGNDPTIIPSEETFKGARFRFSRGDYDLLLMPVVENLKKAKEHALNDTEVEMLAKYVDHFVTGRLQDHYDGSRFWIKDKGPIVETYLGFVENYRDPAGQRAEFEGFVSMVNKEVSKKFGKLVSDATIYLEKLPWSKEFEKDKFLKPDFTSLDVLTFAGSSIPAGINIPNYDCIRMKEGFKNVSLGNVMNCKYDNEAIPFLSTVDQELMHKHRISSFDVQVGLHELLGHGSGKILQETAPGEFNFDRSLKNPLTNEPVATWYKPGQGYDLVFGALGSSFEECRAETVGLYLSLEKDIARIFQVPEADIDDIIYTNWLHLIWMGLGKSLEMYNPASKKWLQAHSYARFVLSRVCLEEAKGFVKIEETEPGKNLMITIDRSKLNTEGKKAVRDFLLKLQIYKATADIESAKALFEKYGSVSNDGPYPWARWRDIILAHKKPRKIFVQSNTCLDQDGSVCLKTYEPNFEGLIQSWIDRFPLATSSENVVKVAERDMKYFKI